ncbi:hypothetical protein VARIO8X_50207 [Burkholderiales bacterium 8X]|nr:hypothetical protein VARIO8X_50207 [Burkholderiales bacterium 8X]
MILIASFRSIYQFTNLDLKFFRFDTRRTDPSSEFRIPNSEFRIPNSEFRIPNSKTAIPLHASRRALLIIRSSFLSNSSCALAKFL